MEVKHKFKVGDSVWVLLKSRPFQTVILERVEGKLFYKLDWTVAGFNALLNTVSISEKAMRREKP